jgi:lipopolysaccharide/colanic/teichoic acid biosynthesis glycosyltransferase
MVVNASQQGPGITRKGDTRITRVGQFIRKYKLDELPQFINVLKGDMSIVGTRPEDPTYVAQYTPEQQRVLSVNPGITSLASIKYHHEEQLLVGENWEILYTNEVCLKKSR